MQTEDADDEDAVNESSNAVLVNESSSLKEFVNDGSDDEDAVNESSNAVLVNESSNAVLVNESGNLKEFVNESSNAELVNESSKLKEFVNDSSDDEDAVNESSTMTMKTQTPLLCLQLFHCFAHSFGDDGATILTLHLRHLSEHWLAVQ